MSSCRKNPRGGFPITVSFAYMINGTINQEKQSNLKIKETRDEVLFLPDRYTYREPFTAGMSFFRMKLPSS